MGAAEQTPTKTAETGKAKDREVGLGLAVGILFFPYIFGWLTLRDGYSSLSRFLSFGWMIFLVWNIQSSKYEDPKTVTSVPSTSEAAPTTETPVKKIDPNAIKGLHKSFDKMEEITWYSHPTYGKYINSDSQITIYMGVKGGHPWLRMMIKYTADEWLFVESYKLLIDGVKFDITGNIETKVGNGGSIHEWADMKVGPDEEAILRAISQSKETTIRYNGRQFYKDRKVSKSEKSALRKMLAAYDAIRN